MEGLAIRQAPIKLLAPGGRTSRDGLVRDFDGGKGSSVSLSEAPPSSLSEVESQQSLECAHGHLDDVWMVGSGSPGHPDAEEEACVAPGASESCTYRVKVDDRGPPFACIHAPEAPNSAGDVLVWEERSRWGGGL